MIYCLGTGLRVCLHCKVISEYQRFTQAAHYLEIFFEITGTLFHHPGKARCMRNKGWLETAFYLEIWRCVDAPNFKIHYF